MSRSKTIPALPAGRQVNDTARRAMRLIESRACDGLTVKEIAETLQISRWTLHREFVAHFSKTAAQMLKLARLKRARELLVGSELAVKQISRKVGFNKVSNFCVFFQRHEGLAPGEFRAACTESFGTKGSEKHPSKPQKKTNEACLRKWERYCHFGKNSLLLALHCYKTGTDFVGSCVELSAQ